MERRPANRCLQTPKTVLCFILILCLSVLCYFQYGFFLCYFFILLFIRFYSLVFFFHFEFGVCLSRTFLRHIHSFCLFVFTRETRVRAESSFMIRWLVQVFVSWLFVRRKRMRESEQTANHKRLSRSLVLSLVMATTTKHNRTEEKHTEQHKEQNDNKNMCFFCF